MIIIEDQHLQTFFHTLQECDLPTSPARTRYWYFNPRISLTECDEITEEQIDEICISIHALPHRMRRSQAASEVCFMLFQSTHSLTECDEDAE